MAIVKGDFDVLFTNIKTALETYSASQATADKFTVYADYTRNFPAGSSLANVFLYMGSINPTEMISDGVYQYDVAYYIDMVAQAKGSLSGAAYERATEAAGIRLRALIQQCLNALFVPGTFSLSLPSGSISKRPMPRIDVLNLQEQAIERPIAGARMTFETGLQFDSGVVEGTDIDSYLVTAPDWSALLEP